MENLKFENVQIFNFEGSLRGMRNPKNSWHLSDSKFGLSHDFGYTEDRDAVVQAWLDKNPNDNNEKYLTYLMQNGFLRKDENNYCEYAFIGPKDMRLAKALINGGSEHRKFLRQILVTVDITAPLFWWKEFDTYKVGTTANSTSTMHKLAETPITRDCFLWDVANNELTFEDIVEMPDIDKKVTKINFTTLVEQELNHIIHTCEQLRQLYLETKDTRYWRALIELLPNSWCQTRTVTLNYENLLCMCKQRRNHKLPEWREDFISWARTLPYASEFIFVDEQDAMS